MLTEWGDVQKPRTKLENCKFYILGLLERFSQKDIDDLKYKPPYTFKMIQKGLGNYYDKPFHHGTIAKALHELIAENEIKVSEQKGPRGGKKYELRNN